MAKKLRIVFNILSVLYPVVVFFLLIVLKLPIRIFSLFILIFGLGYLGVSALKGKQDKKKSERRVVVFSSLLFLLMAGSFITNSSIFIRLYSFFVNMGMFFLFFSSLFLPEPIVYRFATLAQPSIRQSITREKVKAYCRKVTVLWCFFFYWKWFCGILYSLLRAGKNLGYLQWTYFLYTHGCIVYRRIYSETDCTKRYGKRNPHISNTNKFPLQRLYFML